MLDKVKRWEESELSGQPVNEKAPTLSPKKKLAPLNEGGPVQLLKLQMDQLREENEALRAQLEAATAATAATANANHQQEITAVERVKEVVVVKEDTEGKAMADAARKEVEEVGAAACRVKVSSRNQASHDSHRKQDIQYVLVSDVSMSM